MTGDWLAYCSACPVPEIANVFERRGIPFHQVTGVLEDDPACWDEIDAWVHAARSRRACADNRLGLMGHYYGGMLDIATDLTQLCVTFGPHIEMLEVDELSALRDGVSRRLRLAECGSCFAEVFDVQADCSAEEFERAERTHFVRSTASCDARPAFDWPTTTKARAWRRTRRR